MLKRVGWSRFVKIKRGQDDFGPLDSLPHSARHLLRSYKFRGVPVRMHSAAWSSEHLDASMARGAHQSCFDYLDFLQEEFLDMMDKGQWVVLPYSLVKSQFPSLRLSPPGVVPQRNRRPRWICDYTWSGVNQDTVPLAPLNAMQFGRALERLLREILLADPAKGPVSMLKLDISDGFYRIALNPTDVPKLGVIFPTNDGTDLVALPLVLPMGWRNSPPIFSAATETAADLANTMLQSTPNLIPSAHPLDTQAHEVEVPQSTECSSPTPSPVGAGTPLQPPLSRDPCLPRRHALLKYVDVYVDDFLALAQFGSQRQVRLALLKAVDTIFRPLETADPPARREPVSLKKLKQGDMTWATIKEVLGWIINTAAFTVSLPPHRIQQLMEILTSIPLSQKRLSVKKWHKILGQLRSMALALPGARHVFSHMQDALNTAVGKRLALKKGVHAALNDFRWMANDITARPTRIQELVPLLPSILGDHDASKDGAGGVVFPASSVNAREPHKAQPIILWRIKWPNDIKGELITDANPHGTITINDLELAGGLFQLEASAQNYDVRERTVVARTDNLSTLFWQRKGSTTTSKCTAAILRLFGIHQRHHRYVPRHDYLPGTANIFADLLSRRFDWSDSQILDYFSSLHPQSLTYRVWTPSKQIVSAVIGALRNRMSRPASVLVVPRPPTDTGASGQLSQISWPSIPYSKHSTTRYQYSKCSRDAFEPENYRQANIPFALAQSRITFGRLARRSLSWV